MSQQEERIGVYICHCGTNIAGVVDVEAVRDFAGDALAGRGVVVARDSKFMCSSLGQELIEKDIEEHGLTGVVVGACSPHMHEATFRGACARAGLNPYLCELVSLREHVSWVHTDHALATAKAKGIVASGVERVREAVPLEPIKVPINAATLVIGGGITGIQAALEIADSGHRVYLVERQASIGGHMAQFDKTFPTLDCAACILTPRMVTAGNHPNITLMTWSEVVNVSGYVGSFTVTVRQKARYVDTTLCTGCGICAEKCPARVVDESFEAGIGYRKAVAVPFPQAVPKFPVIDRDSCTFFERGTCRACEKLCPTNAIDFNQKDELVTFEVGNIVVATGYELFDPRRVEQYGYGRLPNVFTSLEFERLSNASGPTEGRVVLRDGVTVPKAVGVIHCVGSRDRNYNSYCSAICCMQSLKFAHLVKERTGATVYEFYIDIRTPGKAYDEFYQRVLEEGTIFVRGRVAEVTDSLRPDEAEEAGRLMIQVEDTLAGRQRRIPVDMVVLSAGLEPAHDARDLARLVGITCSSDGWITERHPKLDPIATMTEGVFAAGCATGPKDIPSSVSQGAAAAARVLTRIQAGEMLLEPVRASVDVARCSGCRICNAICPFSAIRFHEDTGVSEVITALCQGCGTCVAACPAGAMHGTGFSDAQVLAQIRGLLSIGVVEPLREAVLA